MKKPITFDLNQDNLKQQHTAWVGKHAIISIKTPEAGTLSFTVQSGDARLYDYFPWLLYIYIGHAAAVVVEFIEENQSHSISVDIPLGEEYSSLTFIAEQGGIPSEVGLSDDVREISSHIYGFSITPGTVADQTPVFHPAPRRHNLKLHSSAPDSEVKPVFVIGGYRQGTSITTWAIGQHPNIFALEETNWLAGLYYGARAAYDHAATPRRSAPQIYDLENSEFLEWQGAAIDRLHQQIMRDRIDKVQLRRLTGVSEDYSPAFKIAASRYNPKRRWVDGTPENTTIAIGLSEMFPSAQFIYCLRKPLDAIKSIINFEKLSGYIYSFEDAAKSWEQMNQYAYEARCVLGQQRVLLSPFSDLERDKRSLARKWWKFLREPHFEWSLDPLGTKINSSSEKKVVLSSDQAKKLKILEKIYDQISSGTRFEDVEWTIRPDPFADRSQNIAMNVRRQMS